MSETSSILAIEATTPICSVALLHHGKVITRQTDEPRTHSLYLLPMIDECLKACDIHLSQLDAIALTRGPGSFTGIRVACSSVQGMAYGANLPVAQVSTLQVVAQNAYRKHFCQQVTTVMDARMDEVYYGEYELDDIELMQPLMDDVLSAPELVKVTHGRGLVGSGVPLLSASMQKEYPCYEDAVPTAVDILPFAVQALVQGTLVTAEAIDPLYLRNKVTHN